MSETVQTAEYGEISPEMALFYRALGTLNTNLVAKIIKDPSTLKTVTENLLGFIADCNPNVPCKPGFCWDEETMSCVSLAVFSMDDAVING
jgi:hypothetical protein